MRTREELHKLSIDEINNLSREEQMEFSGIPSENRDWGLHQKKYEALKEIIDKFNDYVHNKMPLFVEQGDTEDEEYIYKLLRIPTIRIGPAGDPVEGHARGYWNFSKKENAHRILTKEQARERKERIKNILSSQRTNR